jgi:hypothetical protein
MGNTVKKKNRKKKKLERHEKADDQQGDNSESLGLSVFPSMRPSSSYFRRYLFALAYHLQHGNCSVLSVIAEELFNGSRPYVESKPQSL